MTLPNLPVILYFLDPMLILHSRGSISLFYNFLGYDRFVSYLQ